MIGSEDHSSSGLQTFLSGTCMSPWESMSEVLGVIHSESLLLEIASICKRIATSEQLSPILSKGNVATMELHIWYLFV